MRGITLTLLLFSLLLSSTHQQWCYYGKFTHNSEVLDANYSPDGKLVVVGSSGNDHNVYNATSFGLIYQYTASTAARSATFSPDQQYIAYGLRNNTVLIRSATEFSFVRAVGVSFSQVEEVHFGPNSDKMIVCGNNGYAIYSVPGWSVLASDYTYGDVALSCRFASNEKYAIGSKDGWTRMYSQSYGLIWSNRRDSSAEIMALDFSPNASWLVVTSAINSRRVIVFDVTSNSN
jgi:WD40 repeat protein